MPTTISFFKDPDYGKSVVLFVLSPAGISIDTSDIGNNLFGKLDFEVKDITVPEFAPRSGFRFSEISLLWNDFLDISFSHADHVLVFVPGKHRFQEISKESVLQQNPDLYSFSFFRFTCEEYTGVEPEPALTSSSDIPPAPTPVLAPASTPAQTLDPTPAPASERLKDVQNVLKMLNGEGWSINAIATASGINAVTIYNIKGGRQSTVSDRVFDAITQLKEDFEAGRIGKPTRKTRTATPKHKSSPAGQKSAPIPPASLYVAVDAQKLDDLLSRLIGTLQGAIDDLKELSMWKS